ncbi:MAG: glucosidase [Verrucomicrobiota bacterium]
MATSQTPEHLRLAEDAQRERNWKRWGPYLSARQWGTVREDYSADGDAWKYFPHDAARSRAYRWGEDGLLGWTDRECRLCFGLALWNRRDTILKERLFGLSNPQGNHGEDVKECYYYLASTPTHSYAKALYKYPQRAFPYAKLLQENATRSREEREFELEDTGIFADNRYFDVFAEYAKAGPDDSLIRLRICNRGPELAILHVLPTLWFRNTWSWNCTHEGCELKPRISHDAQVDGLVASHQTLGTWRLRLDGIRGDETGFQSWLFTENETNTFRLFGSTDSTPYVKDAFHEYVVEGRHAAVNPDRVGTKAAAHCVLTLPPGAEQVIRLRLAPEQAEEPFADFDAIFTGRIEEMHRYYETKLAPSLDSSQRSVVTQAYAGLLWCKQFYQYIVEDWLRGDPAGPPPPPGHMLSRNEDWSNVFSRDVLSMPDNWEYPWFASWDLAFHMLPFARIDGEFAKHQLQLLLREWYMHPNGQIPAYEWNFCDVNPPVHAWACWRVYKIAGRDDGRDRLFLERTFQKLLLNFTWWVNRKDIVGKHVFAGGFLGLDNIGLFDRSKPLPGGESLEQADGTAWMAFYCGTMLSIALELALHNPAYEDIASKFFEHFVEIVDAMNGLGGQGLWNEEDGFYYDQLAIDGASVPVKVRSIVGIIPLFAVEILEQSTIDRLPGFRKRLNWFLTNRRDLAGHISYMEGMGSHGHRLLAIPSRDRLLRVLRYVLDPKEFLSPYGVRSLSKAYEKPYTAHCNEASYCIGYEPAESRTGMFGGNSNWRGPVWFPINYLLIEALERYHHFYGESVQVECPTGSGNFMDLKQVAQELARRLASLFEPDAQGRRPIYGEDAKYAEDPYWRELVLFHEYFHGETGRGLGASHQTGWTALITRCFGVLAARGA